MSTVSAAVRSLFSPFSGRRGSPLPIPAPKPQQLPDEVITEGYLWRGVQVHIPVPKPQPLPDAVIVEGDPSHTHEFDEIPWDPSLGRSITDFDNTEGNRFAMCTYKELHACSCGRRVVFNQRALI